jgi:hypothetical protein
MFMVDKLKNAIVKWGSLMLFISGMLSLSGCYYDDVETLYPQISGCDTTNVTYGATISQIMANNCNGCHSGSSANANVRTDNYTDLKIIADNGKLWGVVSHASGYSPMPKDRPKLSDCVLSRIKIWIDGGALDN